jgi:hypothetical protein
LFKSTQIRLEEEEEEEDESCGFLIRNLINGLVQTIGLKQVVIWAYFLLWA